MEKTESVKQVIEETDLKSFALKLMPLIHDMSDVSAKMANCGVILLQELKKITVKVNKMLHEACMCEGYPYGDSESGYFLWLKELQDREKDLQTNEKAGENGH